MMDCDLVETLPLRMKASLLITLTLATAAVADDRFANIAATSPLPSGDSFAAKFKSDAGITSHANVIFADNFEDGELGARWDEKGAGKGKALSFAPAGGGVVGQRCMKVEARLGETH